MKSFKIKKNSTGNKKIYLAGGIKTPFKKPKLPLFMFFKINKPNRYKQKQIYFNQ